LECTRLIEYPVYRSLMELMQLTDVAGLIIEEQGCLVQTVHVL